MMLLNFAHPLTGGHLAAIQALIGQSEAQVVSIASQIDPQQPLGPQVVAMVDSAGLSPTDWQSMPILVNLPSLNFSAALILAELHGRMGYFPAIVRLRPVPNSLPTRYELAEVINLQAVRDVARARRIP